MINKSTFRLFDSHSHLQDKRLEPNRSSLIDECMAQGVVGTVINATCPDDWPRIAELAQQYPNLIPSFGVHPWYINTVPDNWRESLIKFLDQIPSAIGEVGIDGWRKEFNPEVQERIFTSQVQIAAERNLPLSIHGLRKWGRLLEILSHGPRPDCGFLLHSYGGPLDMIAPFTKLGAYFSCPGFFLQAGREMKLAIFKDVPSERLLLETDAPDQNLPEELDHYRLHDLSTGSRINHPANISAVYRGVAALRKTPLEQLAEQVEANFRALFANVITRQSRHDDTSKG